MPGSATAPPANRKLLAKITAGPQVRPHPETRSERDSRPDSAAADVSRNRYGGQAHAAQDVRTGDGARGHTSEHPVSGRRRLPSVGSGAGGMAAGFGVTAVLIALLVGTASLDSTTVQSLGMATSGGSSSDAPDQPVEQEELGRLSATTQVTPPPDPPVGMKETVVVTVRPSPVAAPVRSSAPKTPPKAADPAPASHQRLSQVAGAIQQYGRSRPTVFTGIDLDTRNNRLIVWRKAEAVFDTKVRALAEGTTVDLRSAPRSLSQLQTLQRDVINFSAAHNVAVVSIAMPYDGSALLVRVSSNLSTGRTVLTRQFGSAVRVEAGTWADGL